MTHAASVQTAPELQALFDKDWTSGKYRRPKCSKSDFYAGWLVAYERFQHVATVEKIEVVKQPKPAGRKATAVVYEQRSFPCEIKDHKHTVVKLKYGSHQYENVDRGDHMVLVTKYSGAEPLKREPTKGPAPMHGTNWSQAIPDSLLRKLAIKAGRPAIAP